VGDLTAGGTRMNAPRRLTNDESENIPTAWTADSKALLFLSDRNGAWGIFKQGINQETADPMFTGTEDAGYPHMSADGVWILFLEHSGTRRARVGPRRLMRIPAGGGVPQFVMETLNSTSIRCSRTPSTLCIIAEVSQDQKQLVITGFDPVRGRGKILRTIDNDVSLDSRVRLSPDGSVLAMTRNVDPEVRIRLLSLAGAADREITLKGWPDGGGINWSPDGKGFYYGSSSAGGCTLLYVDLKGNARVLWQKKGSYQTWGIPSPDGRHLAILGGVVSSNAWMLEGF
jgi:Tol biopolymer transport system component